MLDKWLNTIQNMDCLEGMRQLPDKCIDLVLTDFPYGIGCDYGGKFNDGQDELKELVDKAMPEILRISKKALITCGVPNIGLYPRPTWILNLYCKSGAGSSQWGFTTWQPILAYGQDPYLTNGLGRRPDTIEFNETSHPFSIGHPCPKPLETWKRVLLRGSVKQTDLILDPFMGSGTTARACKDLGRNFIGFELETKYVEIANKRLQQEVLL